MQTDATYNMCMKSLFSLRVAVSAAAQCCACFIFVYSLDRFCVGRSYQAGWIGWPMSALAFLLLNVPFLRSGSPPTPCRIMSRMWLRPTQALNNHRVKKGKDSICFLFFLEWMIHVFLRLWDIQILFVENMLWPKQVLR